MSSFVILIYLNFRINNKFIFLNHLEFAICLRLSADIDQTSEESKSTCLFLLVLLLLLLLFQKTYRLVKFSLFLILARHEKDEKNKK